MIKKNSIVCLLYLAVIQFNVQAGRNYSGRIQIKGHITDQKSNMPIPAVSIRIHRTVIQTFSKIDGGFTIDSLTWGKYNAVVEGTGYLPVLINLPEIKTDTVIQLDTKLMKLNDAMTGYCDTCTISGLLIGKVKNSQNGEPISGVSIHLQERRTLQTDDNGSFSIVEPDSCKLKLVFTHSDYKNETEECLALPGRITQVVLEMDPVRSQKDEKNIRSESVINSIDAVLVKDINEDNGDSNQGRSVISGTVTDSDDKPQKNVSVLIRDSEIKTLTDDHGYFSFRNLESGNYSLMAIRNEADTAHINNVALGNGRTEYVIIKFTKRINLLRDTVSPVPEKALVKGTLTDGRNGNPLAGVRITIENEKETVLSDQNGRYLISTNHSGNIELRLALAGFEDSVLHINAVKGSVTRCDAALLKSEVEELSRLTVQSFSVKNTDEALLRERKMAFTVNDAISSEEISRVGAGTAAEALRVVPGIIVIDDKYVVIRGLSGRLVSTSLNGQWIPSPDPDELQFPLDLLPTGLVNNITVEKSFKAERRGDFGGGLVNIETRKAPDKPTLKVNFKISTNSNVFRNDTFLSYEGGSLDWLGIDDGTRDIPEIFNEKNIEIPTSETMAEKDTADVMLLDSASKSFNNIWGFKESKAGPDLSGTLEMGNKIKIGDVGIGGMALLNYSRKFSYYEDGISARYEATGTEYESSMLTPTFYRSDRKGSEKVLLGTLMSGEVTMGEDHSVDIMYLYVKSSDDAARVLYGPVANIDDPLETREFKFVERDLSIAQVNGSHTFKKDIPLEIEWRGSWCSARQKEPDLRLFLMSYNDSGNYMIHGTQPQPSRYYRNLIEDGFQGYADFTVHLDGDENSTSDFIKFGGAIQRKNRTYNERYFEFVAAGGSPVSINTVGGDPSIYMSDSLVGLLNDTTIIRYNRRTRTYDTVNDYTWGVYVRSLPFNADYTSQMILPATYVTAGWTFFEILKTTGGIRFEYSPRKLDMKDSNKVDVNINGSIDVLPGIGIMLSPSDEMNIRLSYSKTISRPTERELSEGGVYDAASGLYILGNSSLKSEKVHSIDLRWEWYKHVSDLLSATLFCKVREEPLEYSIDQQKNQMKPGNVTSGVGLSFGVELEGRIGLENVNKHFRNWSVVGNVSLVHSQVNIDSAELEQKRRWDPSTPSKRPLTYQAPYAWNFCLVYDNEDLGIGASVIANNVGPYIVARNVQAPDVVQKSKTVPGISWLEIPSVTATAKVKIMNRLDLNAEVKNIFDPEVQQVLEFKGKQYVSSSKRKGRTFSLKVSYSF